MITSRAFRWLLPALPALAAACTRPDSASPAPAPTADTVVTPRFCAHGGVGVVPSPLPPGTETQFAAVVFDVHRTGAPAAGVSVSELVLLDDAGAVAASMKRVVHLVELPSAPPPPAPGSNGSSAFYLNPQGAPFAGTLPVGKTRLRVRAALDRAPNGATRFRLKLGGGAPAFVEGPIDSVWPT